MLAGGYPAVWIYIAWPVIGALAAAAATWLRTSAGTVNSQLSRAYAKLGVRSRATLREALPRAPASTHRRAG